MQLLARVEADLHRREEELRATPAHYGLVFPLSQPDLLAALRPVRFYGRGTDLVLGSDSALEPHGGGVLRLLLDHWRPDSRPATLEDRFWFEKNRQSLALGALYRAHRHQLFLPVEGVAPERIAGRLPRTPQLPRMRLPFTLPGQPTRFVEVDAYKTLGLLIELEPDPSRTWVNALGQELSVDLLMHHVRDHYLSTTDTPAEPADHSELHLVELLLAYRAGAADAPDVAQIQQRFLEVELARTEFEPADEPLLRAHYAESLGLLLEEPRLDWRPSDRERVRAWLGDLDERFVDLDTVPVNRLSHLLRGLRGVASHWRTLD